MNPDHLKENSWFYQSPLFFTPPEQDWLYATFHLRSSLFTRLDDTGPEQVATCSGCGHSQAAETSFQLTPISICFLEKHTLYCCHRICDLIWKMQEICHIRRKYQISWWPRCFQNWGLVLFPGSLNWKTLESTLAFTPLEGNLVL